MPGARHGPLGLFPCDYGFRASFEQTPADQLGSRDYIGKNIAWDKDSVGGVIGNCLLRKVGKCRGD